MAIKINNNSYSGFFLNGEAINTIYLNGNQVFSKEEPQPSSDPLRDSGYFVVKANSATTLSVLYKGSPTSTIYYKKNGVDNWTTITGDTDIILSQGDYLEMKGNLNNTRSKYINFRTTTSDNIDVGGCIMALNKNAEIDTTNNNIETVSFTRLFMSCSGLTSAEHLKMADDTYPSCYMQMFGGCPNLKVAPQLPSKTVTNACYAGMFGSCRNLKVAPQLLSKTLDTNCYGQMFANCSSLTSLTVGFSSTAGVYNPLRNWLSKVTTDGVCYCPSDADYSATGLFLPSTWTLSKTLSPSN